MLRVLLTFVSLDHWDPTIGVLLTECGFSLFLYLILIYQN